MMKMRLLAVVLFILGAAGVVLAADVINVAIKSYNDNTPYIGNGAYDVGNNAVWTPYYGGWGVPVGSARSEALTPQVPASQQYLSSVYAAQVWIGDNGQNHSYQSGSGLMNNGFVANPGPEPNISIFGQGGYQGVYDIYVYGRDPGLFRLTRYGVTTTQAVSGDANAGEFKLGQNYVVFPAVDINDANSWDLYLTYTNKLNALQFVKNKSPFVIEPNALGLIRIPAGNWDVAGDRNMTYSYRTDQQKFGPDTFFDDVNGIGSVVGYVDGLEFMDYDINVKDTNAGQYQICLGVMGGALPPNTNYGYIPAGSVRIYLDGSAIGEVNHPATIPAYTIGDTTTVTANLYAGIHTVRWLLYNGSGNTGFNLAYVKFQRIGNLSVGFQDLASFVDNWLICDNPDPNGCL